MKTFQDVKILSDDKGEQLRDLLAEVAKLAKGALTISVVTHIRETLIVPPSLQTLLEVNNWTSATE